MSYSISEAASLTNTTPYTLRFYDKKGLMPVLNRNSSNNRVYSENDIHWINLVTCLKNSGMPLKEVKEFMELCLGGNMTAEDRKDMLLKHRERINAQMAQLECSLSIVNYKIDHYKEVGIFHIDG